mmetsp:Transcript_28917/g.55369  ORF Transcript_28917/g.55369 Transcript_28917/m.55369 type:complete len:204 (+) Transcript_28917:319-930(+)
MTSIVMMPSWWGPSTSHCRITKSTILPGRWHSSWGKVHPGASLWRPTLAMRSSRWMHHHVGRRTLPRGGHGSWTPTLRPSTWRDAHPYWHWICRRRPSQATCCQLRFECSCYLSLERHCRPALEVLNPLVDQALRLLLFKLLIIRTDICLMLVARVVLLSHRRRIMSEIHVAIVAVVLGHDVGYTAQLHRTAQNRSGVDAVEH